MNWLSWFLKEKKVLAHQNVQCNGTMKIQDSNTYVKFLPNRKPWIERDSRRFEKKLSGKLYRNETIINMTMNQTANIRKREEEKKRKEYLLRLRRSFIKKFKDFNFVFNNNNNNFRLFWLFDRLVCYSIKLFGSEAESEDVDSTVQALTTKINWLRAYLYFNLEYYQLLQTEMFIISLTRTKKHQRQSNIWRLILLLVHRNLWPESQPKGISTQAKWMKALKILKTNGYAARHQSDKQKKEMERNNNF